MRFGVFGVDIELEPNELDVAGVQDEGTLEVCIVHEVWRPGQGQ